MEWLNLVFANRNQSYGAYELRKLSNWFLNKALMVSIALFSTLFIIPSVIKLFKNDVPIETIKQEDPVLSLKKIDVELKKIEIEVPQAIQKPAQKLKTVNLSSNIKVKPDELVQKDAPTITDVKSSVISTEDADGMTSTNSNQSTSNSDGTATGTSNIVEPATNEPLIFVDQMPDFPGGMGAWQKFLAKNLNYPVMAKESEISGRVTVSFVVEKNGEITNLKVIRGVGGGCDEEAIRVIKKSPNWKPGMQNGKPVRVSYVMPIVFRLN